MASMAPTLTPRPSKMIGIPQPSPAKVGVADVQVADAIGVHGLALHSGIGMQSAEEQGEDTEKAAKLFDVHMVCDIGFDRKRNGFIHRVDRVYWVDVSYIDGIITDSKGSS